MKERAEKEKLRGMLDLERNEMIKRKVELVQEKETALKEVDKLRKEVKSKEKKTIDSLENKVNDGRFKPVGFVPTCWNATLIDSTCIILFSLC